MPFIQLAVIKRKFRLGVVATDVGMNALLVGYGQSVKVLWLQKNGFAVEKQMGISAFR